MDHAFKGSQVLKNSGANSNSLGRLAFPEEMSEILLFLSSLGASFVTGVGWIVGGGLSAVGLQGRLRRKMNPRYDLVA